MPGRILGWLLNPENRARLLALVPPAYARVVLLVTMAWPLHGPRHAGAGQRARPTAASGANSSRFSDDTESVVVDRAMATPWSRG
jgi:hypothetical protein